MEKGEGGSRRRGDRGVGSRRRMTEGTERKEMGGGMEEVGAAGWEWGGGGGGAGPGQPRAAALA